MRLIDADALKHTLCELERRAGFGTVKDSLDGFKLLIENAPTVGAVPVMTYPQVDGLTPTVVATPDKVRVVRCKDCRKQLICYHSDNYFCADGERKNDTLD